MSHGCHGHSKYPGKDNGAISSGDNSDDKTIGAGCSESPGLAAGTHQTTIDSGTDALADTANSKA